MRFRLNPLSPNGVSTAEIASPVIVGGGSTTTTQNTGSPSIPQYNTDPASPTAEDAWVLRTAGIPGTPAGIPLGLLLSLTSAGTATGADTYQFSYRTHEGSTVRIGMA